MGCGVGSVEIRVVEVVRCEAPAEATFDAADAEHADEGQVGVAALTEGCCRKPHVVVKHVVLVDLASIHTTVVAVELLAG